MIQEPTLEEILANSHDSFSVSLKKLVHDLLVNLREMPDTDGTIIILGYKDEYNQHVGLGMNRDLFEEDPISIYNPTALERIYETTIGQQDDGAILVDPWGIITNSGVYLEPRLKHLLEELGMLNDRDYSQKYGFAEHVGTRHLNSIASSYRMPDATIFTLSASSGRIRIYEQGKIIYSPIPEEIVLPKKQKLQEELVAA